MNIQFACLGVELVDEIDGVGDGGGGIGLLGVEQEAGQADQVTGSTEKGGYTIVLTNTNE